jgi:hypothetical protein
VVKDIVVKDAPGKGDFLRIDRFILDYSLMPLLRKQLVIKEIRLDSPHIKIRRDSKGRFSFQDIIDRQKKRSISKDKQVKKKAKAEILPVSIVTDKIIVNDAQISFMDDKKVLPDIEGVSDMQFTVNIKKDMKKTEIKGTLDLKRFSLFINGKEIKTKGKIEIDRERIAFKLNTILEGDSVQIQGRVLNYLAEPDIEKNIYSKSLDLEKIIALVPTRKKDGSIAKARGASLQGGSGKTGKVSPLKLTAHGQMKVERAKFKGYEIKDFFLQYTYKDEMLDLKPLKCEITGGEAIDVEGKVEGEFKLRYSTTTPDPLKLAKKTLRGKLIARLSKGEIKKSRIADAIATFTGLDELRRLTFQKAEFDLNIANERVNVKGFMNSDYLRINPSGIVDFDQDMDIKAEMKVSPVLSSKLTRNIEVANFMKDKEGWTVIYLKIKGNMMKPSVRIDTSRIGKTVERQIKKEIEKRIMERISPERSKGRKTLEKNPEDLIKGLFGK